MKNSICALLITASAISVLGFFPAAADAAALANISTAQSSSYLFIADRDTGLLHVFEKTGTSKQIKEIMIGDNPSDMVVYDDRYLIFALTNIKKLRVLKIETLQLVGDISLNRKAFSLALDGTRILCTAYVSPSDYQANTDDTARKPFFINFNANSITSSTLFEPSWPMVEQGYYRGQKRALLDAENDIAYIYDAYRQPASVLKADYKNLSEIRFIGKSATSSLGQSISGLVLSGGLDYLFAGRNSAEGGLIKVDSASLQYEADLLDPENSPPVRSVGLSGSRLYAGAEDIVYVVNAGSGILEKKIRVGTENEAILENGLSIGNSIYALTSDSLYLISYENGNALRIYDFVSGSAVEQPASYPDLSAASFSLSNTVADNPHPGDRIDYEVAIGNTGSSSAIGPFSVRILLDGRVIATERLSASLVINPGSSYTHNGTTTTTFASAGTYRLEAVLDFGEEIVESDESNNSLSINISVSENTCGRSACAGTGDGDGSAKTELEMITDYAAELAERNFEAIRNRLPAVRDLSKEVRIEKEHIRALRSAYKGASEDALGANLQFIAYGVDSDTAKLGERERAAVVLSFASAYGRLANDKADFEDLVKIALGRYPSTSSVKAENNAQELFKKVYKRSYDPSKASDRAAVTIMAYGLRQKAANRNLASEKAALASYRWIFGRVPGDTTGWNVLQAITYSGAKR